MRRRLVSGRLARRGVATGLCAIGAIGRVVSTVAAPLGELLGDLLCGFHELPERITAAAFAFAQALKRLGHLAAELSELTESLTRPALGAGGVGLCSAGWCRGRSACRQGRGLPGPVDPVCCLACSCCRTLILLLVVMRGLLQRPGQLVGKGMDGLMSAAPSIQGAVQGLVNCRRDRPVCRSDMG